jgi:hypothetical protein
MLQLEHHNILNSTENSKKKIHANLELIIHLTITKNVDTVYKVNFFFR